jgi:hypothetical protein
MVGLSFTRRRTWGAQGSGARHGLTPTIGGAARSGAPSRVTGAVFGGHTSDVSLGTMVLRAFLLTLVAACGGQTSGAVDRGQGDGGSSSSGGGSGGDASSSSGGGSGGDASSSSSGSSGTDGGAPPLAGCTQDPTLNCLGVDPYGYSCADGGNPEAQDPGLSCAHYVPPGANPPQTSFCCFSGFVGSPTTCEPDSTLAVSVCPLRSYVYQCDGAYSPTSTNPSLQLQCGAPVPDPDGMHFDYCCYPP